MSYLGQGLGLGREERFTATATDGQTTVTVGDDGRSISYTPNYVDVYLNGIKMVNGQDITVSSGTSVVFTYALTVGDVVDVVAPGYFQPADTVSRSLGGTFLGAVNFPSGGLNVGSGQLQVDSSGRVIKGNQPAFHASGSSQTTTGYFTFSSTRFNIGSHYNTANGRFTAPVAGRYMFGYQLFWAPDGSTRQINLHVNGASVHEVKGQGAGSYQSLGNMAMVNLAAGDYVQVMYSSGGAQLNGGDYNYFCGYLL